MSARDGVQDENAKGYGAEKQNKKWTDTETTPWHVPGALNSVIMRVFKWAYPNVAGNNGRVRYSGAGKSSSSGRASYK